MPVKIDTGLAPSERTRQPQADPEAYRRGFAYGTAIRYNMSRAQRERIEKAGHGDFDIGVIDAINGNASKY